MPQTERIVKADNSAISNIFGQFDENISRIEKELSVRIVNRSDGIKIVGEVENCLKAEAVVEALVEAADKGEKISSQSINYMVNSSGSELKEVGAIYDDCICLTVNGRPVKPKTIGQKKYVDMIRNNTITFGIGPAGTGKTYLAMAMAITAFKNNEVNRIIMTPEHAKRLFIALQDNISKYESQNGPITFGESPKATFPMGGFGSNGGNTKS